MSAPASGGLAYQWVPRLGGAGVRLRLVPPVLEWGVGLAEGRLALADVAAVRLGFRPARLGSPSFEMEITGRDGVRLTAGSVSRVSLTGTRDQREEFAAFVRAFHAARAAAGGPCRYTGGYAPWRFWLMAVLAALAVAALLTVLGAALADRQWSFALFIGAMSGFVMWPTLEMVWRNRPTTYTPQALPPELLPR